MTGMFAPVRMMPETRINRSGHALSCFISLKFY